MSDESATPEDDPREMGVGDQQPEEQPGRAAAAGPGAGSGTDDPDAPSTSPADEGDSGKATGNGAAGS